MANWSGRTGTSRADCWTLLDQAGRWGSDWTEAENIGTIETARSGGKMRLSAYGGSPDHQRHRGCKKNTDAVGAQEGPWRVIVARRTAP